MDDPKAASTLTACYDAVDAFIYGFASRGCWALCSDWRCIRKGDNRLYPWDDPVHQGRAVVEMTDTVGLPRFPIQLFVTVEWDKANMHLTRQNEHAGLVEGTWDVPIPGEWLPAMKALSWPAPRDEFSIPWG